MRLRKAWLAVSHSKSTIRYSPAPSNVVPPLSESADDVIVELGAREMSDPSSLWIAVSQEDGTSAV